MLDTIVYKSCQTLIEVKLISNRLQRISKCRSLYAYYYINS